MFSYIKKNIKNKNKNKNKNKKYKKSTPVC
jgi:hypothetical protein